MDAIKVPVVHASSLTKQFPAGEVAVDRLDLSVSGGEVLCLLGAPKSGKTTALELLIGLVRPTSGQALVDGVDPANDPVAVRQRVTFVSQRCALDGAMTALQNVETFSSIAASWRRPAIIACHDAMRAMGVPDRAFDRTVDGAAKELILAVWLAIAMIRDTPVLMLDEPTRGLDTRAAANLHDNLQMFRQSNKAVLIATADVLFAARIADRVAILDKGRKVVERPGAHFLGLTVNDLYSEYMGRPSTLGA